MLKLASHFTKSVNIECSSFGTSNWIELTVEDNYGSRIEFNIFTDDVTIFQAFRAQANSAITNHLASEKFQEVLTKNHE